MSDDMLGETNHPDKPIYKTGILTVLSKLLPFLSYDRCKIWSEETERPRSTQHNG
jgi:hypothetical protein